MLQHIFDARTAQDDGSAFEFWFSTTSALQKAGSKQKKAFREVEVLVAEMAQQSNGRLANFFTTGISSSWRYKVWS